jgi:hypothetical protein
VKWRHKERRAATPQIVHVTPMLLPVQTAMQAMTPIQLETVGGEGVVSFYVGEGATLPPGMFLSESGVLSGTPTLEGSYIFTIEAVDSGI